MRTTYTSFLDQVVAFSELTPSHTASDEDPELSTGLTRPDDRNVAAKVWATSDGVLVLHPSSTVGSGIRRRRISGQSSAQLDPGIRRLSDQLEANNLDRLLVLADSAPLLDAIVATPRDEAVTHTELWIAATDVELLARQRTRTSAKLVDWTTKTAAGKSLERHLATLHGYNIDVMAMPHKDWSAGSVALCHRFGILAYGWGCEHEREMAALVDNGIDAVQSRYPHRLAAVIDQYR